MLHKSVSLFLKVLWGGFSFFYDNSKQNILLILYINIILNYNTNFKILDSFKVKSLIPSDIVEVSKKFLNSDNLSPVFDLNQDNFCPI